MFNLKRKRRLDTYKALAPKPEPKETLADVLAIKAKKPAAKKEKLKKLIALCSEPNAPKLTKKDVKDLDMKGVDAKGLDLSVLGENALRAIDWTNADLSNQKFQNMNLNGMAIADAKLHNTTFDKCDLQNANMKGAVTGLTTFKSCDMRGAAMKLTANNETSTPNSAVGDVSGTTRAIDKLQLKEGMRPRGLAMTPAQYKVLDDMKAADGYEHMAERPVPTARKAKLLTLDKAA